MVPSLVVALLGISALKPQPSASTPAAALRAPPPRRPTPRHAPPRLCRPPAASDNVSADTEAVVKKALAQTGVTVAAAGLFCVGVALTSGADAAEQWLAAYVLEESLSVDNLFVFSLIFQYFQTPATAQPRVLAWGLIGAAVLRLLFISSGLAVVQRFELALLPCALLLLYSAYGILTSDDEPDDLSENAVVRLTQKYLPSTDEYDGDRFFTLKNGAKLATPLLLALVCIEISDVIFAVDSIPAVFGVTTDPFIAFSSNIFALIGLRQLYVIIAEAVESLVYLRPAIAFVLAFIGVKLILGLVGLEVGISTSLGVVVGSLGAGVGASLFTPGGVKGDDN